MPSIGSGMKRKSVTTGHNHHRHRKRPTSALSTTTATQRPAVTSDDWVDVKVNYALKHGNGPKAGTLGRRALMDMFEQQELVDVVLTAGDGEVSVAAHRVVMAMTSPYLRARFRNTMADCQVRQTPASLAWIIS
jgi:hypothetical protein